MEEIMHLRLRGRYADFMKGKITVEDLDDDELAQGRLKASDGSFRGRPPMVIPTEMVNAMRREWLGRAEARLREALLDKGIGTLVSLAGDTTIDPAVRLRASERLIERTMGKVPERVHFAAEDPVETLFRNILSDPAALQSTPTDSQGSQDSQDVGDVETKTTLEMLL